MRYLTYSLKNSLEKLIGVLKDDDTIVPLNHPSLPATLVEFIGMGDIAIKTAEDLIENSTLSISINDVEILAPLQRPSSLRDFYAFEEHVATANQNRGQSVPKEWYEFPVFYFSNPYAVFGHGDEIKRPDYSQALDFELEVAVIIGEKGKNISAENSMDYTFGFTIFNDWSARDIQKQEMKVKLGPAKGKDFASSFGPYIVTPDEIEAYKTDRPGVYNLEMTASHNGKQVSKGNWGTIYYSFGEMIARASDEVTLYPGDIIGSGTVGTGCLLEITKGKGPWLQPGDEVTLEIEKLGKLTNKITS